jgi:hypothetical protein
MDRHKNASSDWIGSLVTELDLIKEKEAVADLSCFRAQLEESQLLERIHETVATINGKVGYQVLYMLDFLPPQRSVLRLSFSKNKTEYIMEIVLRTSGPAVVFHSVTRASGSWDRYLHGSSPSLGAHIAFNQNFKPAEISNETMRTWFSFLLSGFKRKFHPGMRLQSPELLDFDLGGLVDEVSA